MNQEFHIFKNNTDAPATNKGFYFQYLLTLQQWVDSYGHASFEIYCEYEDDILFVDTSTDTRRYTQVKCYSTDFALTSDEVVQSLINFFKLHLRYKQNYKGSYIFCTTAGIKPKVGKNLKEWYDRQQNGNYSIDDYLLPTKESIVNYLEKIKVKYLKANETPESLNYAIAKIEKFIEKINSKEFEDFLSKVRWDFRECDDDSFEQLTEQIISSLKKMNYNANLDGRVFLAYLLRQVISSSTKKNSFDRKLDQNLLNQSIEDTQNKSKIYSVLDDNLEELFSLLPAIHHNIGEVKRDVKRLVNTLEQQSSFKFNHFDAFYVDLQDWFKAIDYQFGYINQKKSNYFLFDIEIKERRKNTRVLVFGFVGEIQTPHIERLIKFNQNYQCEEAWIVSTGRLSPAARAKLESVRNGGIYCYSFDELLDETINLDRYFDWVEKEIKTKKIDERFIPVAVKKGEFDVTTKEVIATSIYGESEGWLAGYIDRWLNDQQKEHISILGEFGTGKTWFTLQYAWKQIKAYKQAQIDNAPRPRIPLLIFLRDFTKAMQVDVLISDFFFRKHQIDMRGVFNAFNQLNKMGKLLLIFDGFDEMADRVDRQKMIDNFWQLASVVKGQSKVVLTCRNEHFATINEGRNLLNAEYRNSTIGDSDTLPHFEVVELLKFNHHQIKQMLLHHTNQATVNIIFKNSHIVDLLSRPIMIEFVLDAIIEIERDKDIDLGKVYFYACRRKMERDITQGRTFTSLSDKFFFMCELAWEMLLNNKLTISYKEFPDIIYRHFKQSIDAKDLDYWRSDLRGQSILVIDDELGNYKPAHKSMLEFFVAYKFAYTLCMLRDEYIIDKENYQKERKNELSLNFILPLLNEYPIHSPKFYLVYNFLIDILIEDEPRLWSFYEKACENKTANKMFINNILTLLSGCSENFSGKDFSNLELFDIRFVNSNLQKTNFSNTIIRGGGFVNCELAGSRFQNTKIVYDREYPVLRDISGEDLFDFTSDQEVICVGRFGFNILRGNDNSQKEFIPFGSKKFISGLAVLPFGNLLCAIDHKSLLILSIDDYNVKEIRAHRTLIKGIALNSEEAKFATFTDGYSDTGELKIWTYSTGNLIEQTIKFNNHGLFDCCFTPQNNQLIAGGRDGVLFWIDLQSETVLSTVTYKEISNQAILQNIKLRSRGSTYIYSVSITSNGELLAIGSTYQNLLIWDINSKTIIFSNDLREGYSTKVLFSPNNEYLAFYVVGGKISILRTIDWSEVYSVDKHTETIKFSSNSKYVLFGEDFHTSIINVLDLSTMEICKSYSLNLDYSNMNIQNLHAPLDTVGYFLRRGATNWYDRTELFDMKESQFEELCQSLEVKNDEKMRAQIVDSIFERINR